MIKKCYFFKTLFLIIHYCTLIYVLFYAILFLAILTIAIKTTKPDKLPSSEVTKN
jgi:hypothetical protein